jgi:hypothetical protein
VAKEKWLLSRADDLLPIGYFHIVFTIPAELNYLVLTNQKEMYSVLFRASSETLLELARDKKFLGANIGFTSILHTWGQNLMNHPHIHCIVPSGGLSSDDSKWVSSRKKFFIPVKVLSSKFRGKFMYYFKQLFYENKILFTHENEELKKQDVFNCFVDRLYSINWVVYSKPPFKSAEYVFQYLGRYTHRVAISNNRIMHMDNGLVVFKWRDYRDGNKEKYMTITAEEFIRRFIMHILPRKFVKIRHYGMISNCTRAAKIKRAKAILKVKINAEFLKDISRMTASDILLKVSGINILKCPCCSLGSMVRKSKVSPKVCSPPNV